MFLLPDNRTEKNFSEMETQPAKRVQEQKYYMRIHKGNTRTDEFGSMNNMKVCDCPRIETNIIILEFGYLGRSSVSGQWNRGNFFFAQVDLIIKDLQKKPLILLSGCSHEICREVHQNQTVTTDHWLVTSESLVSLQ